ncbi:MAG: hypothetical protein ACOCV4_07065, partial [Myxococcota bacterium]
MACLASIGIGCSAVAEFDRFKVDGGTQDATIQDGRVVDAAPDGSEDAATDAGARDAATDA